MFTLFSGITDNDNSRNTFINSSGTNAQVKRHSRVTHGQNSISHPKKDREAFRQALVGIIM